MFVDWLVSFDGPSSTSLLVVGAIFLYATLILVGELKSGIRRIPGPVFARVSNLYLFTNGLKANMHILFPELHDKYGDIVRVGPNKVSISDPNLLSVIYGINSNYLKAPFYDTFTDSYKGSKLDNVFATRDPVWHKNMKSAVASSYSLSYLKQFEPMVDECSRIFVDAMHELAGQSIDLGQWLQWYAFDVIGNITFSQTFNMLKQRADLRKVISGLEAGNRYNTVIGQLPGLHQYLLGNAKLVGLANKVPALAEANPVLVLNEMAQTAMDSTPQDDAEETKERGRNYLQFLRKVQIEKPGRLSDRDVWSALLVNMFAGSDTTAIALRAIFYYLAQESDSYRKLQEEIAEAENAGKFSQTVTFEQGSKLSYLQAVIKEAMRLHPGVSYPLERVVPDGGAEMCGYYLPGGTVVGMHAWVIHRNQKIFGEDATCFRPERWLSGDMAQVKIMDQHLMTFGAGNRTCLGASSIYYSPFLKKRKLTQIAGKHISMLEMTKFVPQLLRHFDFEWAEKGDDWIISGYWFAKQTGMSMRLTPKKVFRKTEG